MAIDNDDDVMITLFREWERDRAPEKYSPSPDT